MKTNVPFAIALLTTLFILTLSVESFSQLPPWLPSNGLQAWYPFNGNANDESGNNRNGTINGGASLTTDRYGTSNSAYQFNGTSGYINNYSFPTNFSAYSYAGWYKSDLTSYPDNNVFGQTGFNASGEVSSFGFSCAGVNINARHRLSDMTLVGCGWTPLDLNWNFIVTTWDGVKVRVYKNGVKIDSAVYPNRSTMGSKFFIGCGYNNGSQIGYFFQGKIDDIAVYNRALTPTEISAMYNAGSNNLPPWLPPSGLIAWYPFNGNANDESGNNRHGTVYGGASLTTDRFGNSNSAYDFDGTSGYIRNYDFPTNLSSYTYFGWYKSDMTTFPDNNAFGQTGFNASGEVSSFGVSCAGTNINARHRLSNGTLMGCGWTPLDLVWNMIATTWDGQWVRVYKNGVKIDSANFNSRSTLGSKFFIGCGFNNGSTISYFFNGKLDDIGVYNRALTSAEISGIYQAGQSPVITSQPLNVTSCVGGSATFTISATGTPPLYYQWYKDGAIIQNAIQSSYTIGNVQIADEGLYSCLVSNQYGNTCSNAASLTVTFVSPPQIWGATTVPEWSVETYSVTQTIGSTYFFSVVNGNKINNTVNSITVQWGSTGWGQIICSETNYLGCTSAPALLDIAIGSVGILETGEKQILIAPNPTSGLFTLDSKLGLNKVSVYTYNGKLIFSSSVSTNPFQVDLSSYAKGIYFVRIATNGATITRKIIVF